MASATAIIEGARRKLGIQEAEEPMQAYEAQEGLTLLNDMLARWVLERDVLSAPTLSSLTDNVYVDTYGAATISDEGNEAFKSCLAVRMADHYGTQASPSTVALCRAGKEAIVNASFDPDTLQADFDEAIKRMPSQRLLRY